MAMDETRKALFKNRQGVMVQKIDIAFGNADDGKPKVILHLEGDIFLFDPADAIKVGVSMQKWGHKARQSVAS